MLSRLRWTVSSGQRCTSLRTRPSVSGRMYCSSHAEELQSAEVDDTRKSLEKEDIHRSVLELGSTPVPKSYVLPTKKLNSAHWLKKELHSELQKGRTFSRPQVLHVVKCYDRALRECQGGNTDKIHVLGLLNNNYVHNAIDRGGIIPAEECSALVPSVRRIVEFSEGNIEFWRRWLQSLLQSIATSKFLDNVEDSSKLEEFLEALVMQRSWPSFQPFLQTLQPALPVVMSRADEVPSDLLISLGRSLFTSFQQQQQHVPLSPFDSALTQPSSCQLQQDYQESVLPELCFRALDFSPEQVCSFVKLWSKIGFTVPFPADVVKSHLDVWPVGQPEDLAALMATLSVLVEGGGNGKYGIDVKELLKTHAAALKKLPGSVAMHFKSTIPYFPWDAKIQMLRSLVNYSTGASIPTSVEILQLLSACNVHDSSLFVDVLSLITSAKDPSPMKDAGHLLTIARTVPHHVGQPLPNRIMSPKEWSFWNFYHKHLLESTVVRLEHAVEIFNCLKSASAAYKLVTVCGIKRASVFDKEAEERVYEATSHALVEIFTTYPPHWTQRQSLAMEKLFSKTVAKIVHDIFRRGLALPHCCLDLVNLHEKVDKTNVFGVPHEVLHLIHAVVGDMPLRRVLDLLRLTADIKKQTKYVFLPDILEEIGKRIVALSTYEYVSAHHCTSLLSEVYVLSQAAHDSSAASNQCQPSDQQSHVPAPATPASAGASPLLRTVYARMWPKLEAARRRDLFSLEEHAAVLANAWQNDIPAEQSQTILLRLLINYASLRAPTPSDQELVLEALTSYTSCGRFRCVEVPTEPHWQQWHETLGSAVTSLLQAVERLDDHDGKGVQYRETLALICAHLGISGPKLEELLLSQALCDASPKSVPVLAVGRNSMPVLWNFTDGVAKLPPSLMDIVKHCHLAHDFFTDGSPYMRTALQGLATPLIAVLDRVHDGYMHDCGSDLLDVAMAKTFEHLVPVWKEHFSGLFEDLNLLDLCALLKLLRLSSLSPDRLPVYHKILSSAVCFHHDQLGQMNSQAMGHVLSEMCASEVCYPAVVQKVAPKLIWMLHNGGPSLVTLPLINSILTYMKTANIQDESALVQARLCVSSLVEGNLGYLQEASPMTTHLAECSFLLAQHGVPYKADPNVLHQLHTLPRVSLIVSSLLNAQSCHTISYDKSVQMLHDLEIYDKDASIPAFLPWCLCLYFYTTPYKTDAKLNSILSLTMNVRHKEVIASAAFKWPELDVMRSMSAMLAQALDGPVSTQVKLAGVVRVPFVAALSADGTVLPQSVNSTGHIVWPDDTVHHVAWLVMPDARPDGSIPIDAQTIVDFEANLLEAIGWKVMMVVAKDITNAKVSPKSLVSDLSAKLKIQIAKESALTSRNIDSSALLSVARFA
ncbi:uncharacterized protein LOC135806145 [Sycon ciliatum]|uniref:uncharacterized protein LOC135806145 n=1 Tax=Sycon ciliatum TaxID=27933 RepID=UPI0031F7024E